MDIPGVEESKGGDSEDTDLYDSTVPLITIPRKFYKRIPRFMQSVLEPWEPLDYNWTNPHDSDQCGISIDWSEKPVKGSDFSNSKSVLVSDFCQQHEVFENENIFSILPIEVATDSVPAKVFESAEVPESLFQQPHESKQPPATVAMSESCWKFTIGVLLFIMFLIAPALVYGDITGVQPAVDNAFVAVCMQIAVVAFKACSYVVASGFMIVITGFCLCASIGLASILWNHFLALGGRHSTASLLLFCVATGVAFQVFVHDAVSCIFTTMAFKTYEFGYISNFWQHAIGLVVVKLALPFIFAVPLLLRAVASEPLSLLWDSLTDELVSALLFLPRCLVLLLLQLHAYCTDGRFRTDHPVDFMGLCRRDYPANLVGCVRVYIDDENMENMERYPWNMIPAKILVEERIRDNPNGVFGVAFSLMGQAFPEPIAFGTDGIITAVGTVVDIAFMHWHTQIYDAISSLYPTSFFSAPDPQQSLFVLSLQ